VIIYSSPSYFSLSESLSSLSTSFHSSYQSPQIVESPLSSLLSSSSYSFILDKGHNITKLLTLYEELVALAEQADNLHTREAQEDRATTFLSSFLHYLTDPLTYWKHFDNLILN
jgi:hypothetical protein